MENSEAPLKYVLWLYPREFDLLPREWVVKGSFREMSQKPRFLMEFKVGSRFDTLLTASSYSRHIPCNELVGFSVFKFNSEAQIGLQLTNNEKRTYFYLCV